MAFDKNQFDDIIQEFTVNGEQLHEIAADFRYDLVKGLENPKESSLRMLKSYVGLPTGKETGEYDADVRWREGPDCHQFAVCHSESEAITLLFAG